MTLVGMLDSPYVRRVAITMRMLGVEYEHKPLSIFRSYKEFRTLNPLVKVPTLICDDGAQRRAALQMTGIALVAMEKVAQRVYELKLRPAEFQYEPWLARINEQLMSAIDAMEVAVTGLKQQWLFGEEMTLADVSITVARRFINFAAPSCASLVERPALTTFSARAVQRPAFLATPP